MRPAANKSEPNNEASWFCLKLSFVLVTLPVTAIMVYGGPGCPFPTGICKLYSFAPLFTTWGKPVTVLLFAGLCVLYLLEKRMLLTTFFLSLLSCIVISHHESNGIFFRATILTVAWIAQFAAYFRRHFNKEFDLDIFREQYVIQVIASTYMLAAIAKLKAEGLGWINAGDMFSIQVIKNYSFLYFDSGSALVWQRGNELAYFFLHHHFYIRLFLAASLFLELFCLLAAFSRKLLWVFGIGLLFMHIGIAAILGISMSVISKPMVVFFLNPLYRMKQVWDWFRQRALQHRVVNV